MRRKHNAFNVSMKRELPRTVKYNKYEDLDTALLAFAMLIAAIGACALVVYFGKKYGGF
jgi:hypothetical protein